MIAYISIGSNIGDRQKNIAQAVDRINERFLVLLHAPIIETLPVGYDDQPNFLNTAISIDASDAEDPEELLHFLQGIEKELGRERSIKNGPRTIDLDIILLEDCKRRIYQGENLIVPHPRMHERRFVLEPLCAIAPNLIHPHKGETMRELLESLEN